MSVFRYDLDKCIGCRMCLNVCPMDVFRYNYENKKSVIAYPENCILCGQCYFYCPAGSLALSSEAYGHTLSSYRPPAKHGFLREVFRPGVKPE